MPHNSNKKNSKPHFYSHLSNTKHFNLCLLNEGQSRKHEFLRDLLLASSLWVLCTPVSFCMQTSSSSGQFGLRGRQLGIDLQQCLDGLEKRRRKANKRQGVLDFLWAWSTSCDEWNAGGIFLNASSTQMNSKTVTKQVFIMHKALEAALEQFSRDSGRKNSHHQYPLAHKIKQSRGTYKHLPIWKCSCRRLAVP